MSKHKVKAFVTRYEMVWHYSTLAIYGAAIITVIVAFPDVSNLWVSLFVLIGTFTASVTAFISAIKGSES